MLDEGELEESMAELEESRRKLVILQLQKKGASAMTYSLVSSINGGSTIGRLGDKTTTLRQLKDSIEEAKVAKCNPIVFYCLKEAVISIKSESLHVLIKYFYFLLWQTLKTNRDLELQEAREDNLTLSKQLDDLEVT